MFMLTTIEDSVRISPEDLSAPAAIAIEKQLQLLYFDRVIPAVGLVISLYDITSIAGADVHSGDGGAVFAVTFRLVVFRPFEGEVLVGQIGDSSPCVPVSARFD